MQCVIPWGLGFDIVLIKLASVCFNLNQYTFKMTTLLKLFLLPSENRISLKERIVYPATHLYFSNFFSIKKCGYSLEVFCQEFQMNTFILFVEK